MNAKNHFHKTDLPFLVSFRRSQAASIAATVLDYLVLFGLVEIFHVWYVTATAIGAFVGAVSNFVMNRFWSFRATHREWHNQAIRYSLISGMSLILNTYGVFVFTEHLRLHYAVSVLAVAALVGVFFNYPLHRFFVFR